MAKLCPTHQQPYREGICPLCEQRAGGAVDYEAECRRLNARLALAERLYNKAKGIHDHADDYADGAEDANQHDRFCAQVTDELGPILREWEAGR